MSTLQGSSRIVTEGLVLYLDAANTKSFPGTSSTFFDLSRESNNGSIDNSPTFTSQYGGGFVFDGIDDAVNVPFDSSLSPSTGITLFSFFNVTGFNNLYAPIIFKENNQSSNYEEYEIGIYPGGFIRAIATGVDTIQRIASYNTNSLNKLTCASATFDTVADEVKLYINGELVDTDPNFTSTFDNNPISGVNIGSVTIPSFPGYVIGTIYVTGIYDRVLSSDEINQNYQALRTRFL